MSFKEEKISENYIEKQWKNAERHFKMLEKKRKYTIIAKNPWQLDEYIEHLKFLNKLWKEEIENNLIKHKNKKEE